MNNRPWQVATVALITMNLLMWSGARVDVSVGALTPKSSNLPDQQSLSSALQQIQNTIDSRGVASASAKPTQPAPSAPPTQTFKQPNPSDPQPKAYYRAASNVFPVPDKSKQPTTDLTTILEGSEALAMQGQIIPKEGTQSPYGLTYNLDTFEQQKNWSKDIVVADSWKDLYQKIADSTYHPCCGVTISTNDCGHAIALTGLVKKMLQDGKSESDIRQELLLWEKYFFPRHYVIMGLALKKLGQPLDKIDLSPEFSTVTSEKYATEYLIY